MEYLTIFFTHSLKSDVYLTLPVHLNLDPEPSSYMWLATAVLDDVALEYFHIFQVYILLYLNKSSH